ncbi:MAG: glycosyltransferase family 1 protein [Chloroflexi bacterium]|nr:glycosyltransferase family 1 protein [Chloroflexota bacterium]
MDIMLTASGTRGDVQPALALSLGLRQAGHTVRIAAGANFKPWIESYGFDCLPLLDMEAMMQSQDGIRWVEQGNNVVAQLRIMRKLINEHLEELTRPLNDHGRDCDLHISGFTSTDMVEVIAEKHRIRHIATALQPYRATRSGAATLVPITRRDSLLNLIFGRLGDRFRWSIVADAVTLMRRREGLPILSASVAIGRGNAIPLVNGYSANVVPHAPDWTPESVTAGYWFLDDSEPWTPPQALVDFCTGKPAPVCIGFGSMSSADPKALFELVCEGVRMSGQRAVFITGWSGLKDVNVPEYIYAIDKAPHGWLFEHVAGVVHHGGAGTTAAGLRAGKPTLIVPHMADQPFWGRRIMQLGVGPRPIARPSLSAERLAAALRTLLQDTAMRRKAEHLGELIRGEDGVSRGVEAIEKFSKRGLRNG